MYAFAFQTGGGALSWQQVLRDIPHDLGAILVYLLLGFFLFLVVYGSRPEVIKRYGGGSPGSEPGSERSAGDTWSSGAGGKAGGNSQPANPR